MLNGKGSVTLVKKHHYSRRDYSKTRKWWRKSEPTPANRAPKPLKINEIDATEETEWTQLTPNLTAS
jgi:hypothetical protein